MECEQGQLRIQVKSEKKITANQTIKLHDFDRVKASKLNIH